MDKKARLTVDMSRDEHITLKTMSAKLGMTMREFILWSAFSRIKDLEDEWLADRAEKILEKIESGDEKLISLETLKKRLKESG